MRAYFEHVLLATLSRRAGINNRNQLIKAMAEAGYPTYPEWLRRQFHEVQGMNEQFVAALQATVPELTDQDWIDIFWGRFFPDEHPPRVQ